MREGPPALARQARTRVASFPPVLGANPYQRLLYEQLARHGIELADDARLKLRWLWAARHDVRFLHFHWAAGFYRFGHGPRMLRRPLSWLELPVFATRLGVARLLGYRIVWTIHQVRPHESVGRTLDRVARGLLARSAHVLITHDRATADGARRELGETCRRALVIPHGSYVGVYPPGRGSDEVRAQLGLSHETFVFLCFGDLRAYKDVELLLEAFRRARLDDAALVVAGQVRSERDAEAVRASAAADPRIKDMLAFVPDEAVAELFGAADAAVLARSDGGTSGSLVLALSLGVPAVAARTAVYEEMVGSDEAAGWLFEPGDPDSFARALERSAGDGRARARARGRAALARADRLRWPEIGRRTAEALLASVGTTLAEGSRA